LKKVTIQRIQLKLIQIRSLVREEKNCPLGYHQSRIFLPLAIIIFLGKLVDHHPFVRSLLLALFRDAKAMAPPPISGQDLSFFSSKD
jgi:hypothetical protein